jgi:hypothetical protein
VIDIASDAIKYAMPQHFAASTNIPRQVQLRVCRPVRGMLALIAGGKEVWSQRIHALPERRILVVLDGLPPDIRGVVNLVLMEDEA